MALFRKAFKRYGSATANLLFVKPTKSCLQTSSFHTSKCDGILLSRFQVSTGWSHAAPSSHFCFKGTSWFCCGQNVIVSTVVAFQMNRFFQICKCWEEKCGWCGAKSIQLPCVCVCVCLIQLKNKQQKHEYKDGEQSRHAVVKMNHLRSHTHVLKPLW